MQHFQNIFYSVDETDFWPDFAPIGKKCACEFFVHELRLVVLEFKM